MKFFDYTKLSFSALVKKIGSSRYFDLPAMLEEVLNRLSGRVETLENAPSGGIESLSGDFVDNTDPTNPVLDRGYKVYTALLSQSGTDAPVATVLENTLGGVPVLSYEEIGSYNLTLANPFPLGKTFMTIAPSEVVSRQTAINTENDETTINIYSGADNVPTDNILYETAIEIRVYN